jgi:hypothetical protein
MCDETIVTRKHYGFQPEFAGSIFAPYVNMGRLVTVETVEEKTIGAWNIPDSRHGMSQRC